ncbi:hypothetical protein [Streptomyces sp. NPDC047028]|uniref:hypothetical protein n=1 Tax=Streptomyces sp. NPDC047028 TaxID=3155793 RepID=UPI003403EF39
MIVTQPSAGAAGVRRRRVVRPAVLVAVLLGLFLMHGGPAAADGGCHGAAPGMPVASHMPAGTAAHAVRAPEGAGPKAVARVDRAARGALCVATTPRSGIPLPPLTAAVVLLVAAVLLPGTGRAYGDVRHRGPPAGGRDLLYQVCVART